MNQQELSDVYFICQNDVRVCYMKLCMLCIYAHAHIHNFTRSTKSFAPNNHTYTRITRALKQSLGGQSLFFLFVSFFLSSYYFTFLCYFIPFPVSVFLFLDQRVMIFRELISSISIGSTPARAQVRVGDAKRAISCHVCSRCVLLYTN